MMTQKDFLVKIREAYIEARNVKDGIDSTILVRGTSHSISSIAEDFFGCYCVNKILKPDNHKIYIDPQLSFKNAGLKNKSEARSLLIRPDIVIARNSVATCFFDIKTDIGFRRKDLLDQARCKNDQLRDIVGKYADVKDGKTKSKSSLLISESIKLVYILLSKGNMNSNQLENLILEIRKLENINILILSNGAHLNTYDPNARWHVNNADFDKLDCILNKELNE